MLFVSANATSEKLPTTLHNRGKNMIISEVMTTKLVTVTPGDTLSYAANLLRQHQFHHLPVVRGAAGQSAWMASRQERSTPPVLEGMLTANDIDVAAERNHAAEQLQRPWEEMRVAEVMQQSVLCVTPTTNVAAAAKLMVERGINYLPVVEYGDTREDAVNRVPTEHTGDETLTYLVGLLTRSDLLLALARALGASEPGMELLIPLPTGDLASLASLLWLAKELHIVVQSVLVVPRRDEGHRAATVRLGTINPAPLFARLRAAGIAYETAHFQPEGDIHAS